MYIFMHLKQMFFSAKPVKIQIKQRKQLVKNNRVFSSPQAEINTFIADFHSKPTHHLWSNQKSRLSDSISSSRLARPLPSTMTSSMRNKSLFEMQSEQCKKKRTYQVLMRQTLRRTQVKNKKTCGSQSANWVTSSKKLINQNSQQNILDYLSELQGTKCKINSTKKIQKPKTITKSKSCQPKQKPKKELQILDEEQKKNNITNSEKIEAIGFYVSKKEIIKNSPKTVRMSQDRNQFCVNIQNLKPELNGINMDNQNNFIRAKFKSNCLNKKINYLQKQEKQIQRAKQSGACSFRNTNSRILMLTGQSQRTSQANKRNEQNARISGWQINYEIQSGFNKDLLCQLK